MKKYLKIYCLCCVLLLSFLFAGCEEKTVEPPAEPPTEQAEEYDETHLDFQLNDDRAGYTVTGRGDCTKADLIIPETYEGLPVTTIGSSAFYSDPTITELTVGNSVTVIDSYAFWGCGKLERITLGNSVTKLEGRSFEDCTALEHITLGDGVSSLSWNVFDGCEQLKSIVIGTKLKTIQRNTFNLCQNLQTVYYRGTAEEWSQVNIQSEFVANATTYYYSETQPLQSGNYWRFQGGVAEKWS